MKIRDVLKLKEARYRDVVSIAPHEPGSDAVRKLTAYDRGALTVCDEEGRLVGIITERDIVRKCMIHDESCPNIRVQDVMTSQVAVGTLDDDLDYALSVMKQKRVRHLPIIDKDKKVVGLVSMRDLLGIELEETRAQIRYIDLLPRDTRIQRPWQL
jgi:CBS domain-containing protein